MPFTVAPTNSFVTVHSTRAITLITTQMAILSSHPSNAISAVLLQVVQSSKTAHLSLAITKASDSQRVLHSRQPYRRMLLVQELFIRSRQQHVRTMAEVSTR